MAGSNATYDVDAWHRKYERAMHDHIRETRQPLREDVQKLVTAHRDERPPPFAQAELVVMAIINTDTEYASYGDLFKWIVQEFPFYKNKAADCLLARAISSEGLELGSWEYLDLLENGFISVFTDHNTPLITDGDEISYTVGVKHARAFLRQWIEPQKEPAGVFRFLDLPAELRNRIYHMLLVYPEPAVTICSDHASKELSVSAHGRMVDSLETRLCSATQCSFACECESIGYFTVDSMQRVLDIGGTCKQIASEAQPIFYSSNAIRIDEPGGLQKFVKATPTRLLRHVKRLHLRLYLWRGMCLAWNHQERAAIEAISSVTSLDKATVTIKMKKTFCGRLVCDKSCAHVDPCTMDDVPFFSALVRFLAKAKEGDVIVEPLSAFGNLYPMTAELQNLQVAIDEFVSEVARVKRSKGQEAERDEEEELFEESQEALYDFDF